MPPNRRDRSGTVVTNPTPNPNPRPQPPSFVITVVDHSLPYETHNIYSITFDSNPPIQTLLTSTPSIVDTWLLDTLRLQTPSSLLIGLDIEWRPNFQRGQSNPAAVLQLCINNRCLVFQILHSPFIPDSLLTFLANPNNRFVGVGIKADVEKLLEDYNIIVTNFVDLRNLAADVLNDREMLRTGIKSLAQRVIEKSVQKPKRVSMSRWDNVRLNAQQVKYATVDAFVSFEIARLLYSHHN
ncbi:hypothetical protein RYX36_029706 [Vicia faba]